MPVRGPAPAGQRRRTNRPTHDWTEVVAVPFTAAPKLPPRPDGRPWPTWSRRWWADVSTMPHAVLWHPSDWRFAMDTALLVAAGHEGGRVASEVRQRERVMGTTVDARRGLRIRYVDPGVQVAPEPPGVTVLDDYREL